MVFPRRDWRSKCFIESRIQILWSVIVRRITQTCEHQPEDASPLRSSFIYSCVKSSLSGSVADNIFPSDSSQRVRHVPLNILQSEAMERTRGTLSNRTVEEFPRVWLLLRGIARPVRKSIGERSRFLRPPPVEHNCRYHPSSPLVI